jgi:pimeloyl-ACP methyl ester carboxylesterase
MRQFTQSPWAAIRAAFLGSFFLFLSFNGHCLTDGYYKLTVKHTGKALTVKDGSTADAAYLVQYTYSGADHQMWYVEKTADTNPETYMLINAKSRKVADVQGSFTGNTVNLLQYHYNGNNNQRYMLEDAGGGYFKIKAKHSGKVLDVQLASTANNANVVQYSSGTGDNQKWMPTPVTASVPPPSTGSQACNTKYPVLLLHGVALTDNTLGYNYFGRIPASLRSRGATVFGGEQDAWGAYTTNAEQIKKRILQITDPASTSNPGGLNLGKVNIIGHSKGGLDTRQMLHMYPEMKTKIASFTTMATPHRGTALADWVFASGLEPYLGFAIKVLSFLQGDTNPNFPVAAGSMRRANMVTTNNQWNSLGGYSGILSQSYAAEIKNDTLKQLDVALLATGWVMGNLAPAPLEPYNDGAVPTSSAPFGTFKGTNVGVTAGYGGLTHFGITDRGILIFPGMTPGYDAPAFYRNVVANLKTAGY